MTKPTFNAIPRARKLQANKFDPKDSSGKRNLIAWLKGHPQVTNVKNGGTYLVVEVENGWKIKVTGQIPYLIWDPIEGLLHYSQEQFDALYRVGK